MIFVKNPEDLVDKHLRPLTMIHRCHHDYNHHPIMIITMIPIPTLSSLDNFPRHCQRARSVSRSAELAPFLSMSKYHCYLFCLLSFLFVIFSVCYLFWFRLSCQVLLVKIASDKCDKCKASNSPKLPSGHSALKPLITIDVARNRKTFLFLFLAIYLQLR